MTENGDEVKKVGPEFPYKVEYAKSGRASCKKCKENIAKDSLRLAIMVRAWAFDGFQPHWYHFACFFLKAQPSSLDQIDGVYSLRPDDQSKLKKKLRNVTGADGKGGAVLSNFVIQYAKSGKAKCRLCEEKIEKDEVRISKKEIDPERSFWDDRPLVSCRLLSES